MDARLNARWLGCLSLLVALMPLSFSVSWHVKALPALLLLIAGLVLLFKSASTRKSYRIAWPIFAICAADVVYTALNIAGHRLGWNAFDLPSHILLYMATAAVFSLPLRMRWVWLGFSLTAIVLGMVSIVQHFFLSIDRAFGLNGGDWGAIEFAMVMLVLSLNGWLQLFYSKITVPEKLFHGVGASLGIYGAMLTQSRGPLVAFIPTLLILLLIYGHRNGHWGRSALAFAAIVCGSVLAAASVHNAKIVTAVPQSQVAAPGVGAITAKTAAPAPARGSGTPSAPSASGASAGVFVTRFTDVSSELKSYDPKTDAKGAIRERLEMWRIAVHAFLDYPLAGVGIDQFGTYVRREVAAGRANPAIAKYRHPHNEYLEAAATGGVPGVLVIVLIFAVPMVFFLRHALHAPESEIIPASIGVATISMYALCGLTDNVFYRAMPHSLYFFLIPGLAVLLCSSKSLREVAPRV